MKIEKEFSGIFRKILRRPDIMRKYQLPLFSPHWEAFLEQLVERRYSLRSLRNFMAHNLLFHRYLIRKGIRSLNQVRPALLKSFLRYYPIQFKKRHGRQQPRHNFREIRNHLRQFLTFAFQKRGSFFFQPVPFPDSRCLSRALVLQFIDFYRNHRGLKENTLQGWTIVLRQLRDFLVRHRISHISKVTVEMLDDFFLGQAKRMNGKVVSGQVSAVRAFFKFLYLHDQFPCDISNRLPLTCRFSRDHYPKYLPWPKIQHLLASIDRTTPKGIRDYAILSLLAYHGLRPYEAVHLHVADIDWEHSCFTVRNRKNGTTTQLPLNPHVKEALQTYLQIRPPCSFPHVFINVFAPYQPVDRHNVTHVVTDLLRRCFGDNLPYYGAHIFRHSFAKVLLDRGAPLPQISTMLGHRNLTSTLTYTQIDTEGLREIADNYANLLL